MKKIEFHSILIFLILQSSQVMAIDEKIFDLNGNDSTEIILKKIGSTKGVKVQVTKDTPERMISLDFTPPHDYKVGAKDLFEQIEISGKRDIVNPKLIIADPKTGRIFHLTTELKVSELDIVKPWVPKNKLKSLKEIFNDMNQHKIELTPKKKSEIKK